MRLFKELADESVDLSAFDSVAESYDLYLMNKTDGELEARVWVTFDRWNDQLTMTAEEPSRGDDLTCRFEFLVACDDWRGGRRKASRSRLPGRTGRQVLCLGLPSEHLSGADVTILFDGDDVTSLLHPPFKGCLRYSDTTY